MRRLRMCVFLASLVVVCVLGWMAWAKWVVPPRLFRRAVLNPIPPSVRDIRGIASSVAGCDRYVLRFAISSSDAKLVLASDQFEEIGYVDYHRNSNILKFGETYQATTSFALFEGWHRTIPPPWFNFGDWSAFKSYLAAKEEIGFCKYRLLLHDRSTGQAYFVGYEARGM